VVVDWEQTMEKRRRSRSMLAILACMGATLSVAHASPADGTWLFKDKMAIQISDCENALCGRIVWLRNPALRTPAMCGRTIVWGLVPEGPSQWSNGWIFDPEDGNTYHLSATLESDDTISARIYEGIALFGETKILTRVAPADLPPCG
jgi:uncharacterized protein (DUF2147 family)